MVVQEAMKMAKRGLGVPKEQVAKCFHCSGSCIKVGKNKNGVQRYKCKSCEKYSLSEYRNKAFLPETNGWIIRLNRECCGVSSISRLLKISKTTVIKRIKKLGFEVRKPLIYKGKTYEVDELKTYIKKKTNECWICLGLERQSGEVVDISVGRRTKKTLATVVETLKLSEAKKVYTDGLDIYKSLISKETHKVRAYHINKVERKNLDLRNSLKRLTRKTICYSKSRAMLEASVRLCLWGE